MTDALANSPARNVGQTDAPDALDALKESFLAMISHELRSPITVISGFLRLLCEGRAGGLNPQQEDLLRRALAHADKMALLVNDLIQFSEIESGLHGEVARGAVDPLAAARAAAERVAMARPARAADVIVEISEDLPPVLADGRTLETILFHLLDNALKFSGDAPVRLRAEVVRDGVRFEVEDQGIGISPQKLNQIFDRFSQLESAGARHYDGLGMGLALSSRLARLSGGELDARSVPGAGSVFAVAYPLWRAGEEPGPSGGRLGPSS